MKKWKHPRAMREVLAEYVALKVGLSQTEADIRYLLTTPDLGWKLTYRLCGTVATARRLDNAIAELFATN